MTPDKLINAAIVGCVLFLALLCFLKKNNARSGYTFLCIVFIVLSISFSGDLLENSAFLIKHPTLTVLFEPVLFTLPPFIYLATKHLTSKSKITLRILFHFIPYLFLITLYVISFFDHTEKNSPTPEPVNNLFELITFALFFIQMCLYLYQSLKLLKRHKQILPFFVSNIPNNDFHWLYNMLSGLCILTLNLIFEILFKQTPLSFYFSVVYLLGFYYVGIQIAEQKNVTIFTFGQKKGHNDPLVADIGPLEKAIEEELNGPEDKISDATERKQLINEKNLGIYKERLIVLMETEKPFLDSELTLLKLSELLDLSTYHTSYLINTCFGENFYTFINRYRLDTCKKMLTDPTYSHLSILGIAFEAGFNSKTTFNTAFKKSTGLSPKAFQQLKGSNS